MSLVVREIGNPAGDPIVFVSGFGDNSSMYDALAGTALGQDHNLIVADLPGFGDADPEPQPLTLDRSADLIAGVIVDYDARVVVGHSLGSITASLAAKKTAPQVHTVVSVEGNLTPEDAYFSGSAAAYDTPDEFRVAFLQRLDAMTEGAPVVRRYRDEVAKADPRSLWELGCDAHLFSRTRSPGEVLRDSAPRVHYLYNPDNTPAATNQWLDQHDLPRTVLSGTSHWKMVDQPDLLGELLRDVLASNAPTP